MFVQIKKFCQNHLTKYKIRIIIYIEKGKTQTVMP